MEKPKINFRLMGERKNEILKIARRKSWSVLKPTSTADNNKYNSDIAKTTDADRELILIPSSTALVMLFFYEI
ncbi:MAG: hypothetical protein ACXVJD_01975 [Mucilaginibacter sp.]